MKLVLALAFLIAAAAPAAASQLGDEAMERTDVTAKLIADDLSDFFKPKDPFIGYIGKTFQRLHIVYTSIRRDAKDGHIYHVTGTSQVKNNRCDFEGEIVIQKITTEPPIDSDEFIADAIRQHRIKAFGRIDAKYELRENPKQKSAGVFSGVLQTFFYTNEDKRMLYDEIDSDPESYWSNNLHTGSWTPYGNAAASKAANWGDHDVPDSGDLSPDHHEFMPDEKYKANGWEDFFKDRGGE